MWFLWTIKTTLEVTRLLWTLNILRDLNCKDHLFSLETCSDAQFISVVNGLDWFQSKLTHRDLVWRHRTWSILVRVTAYCLIAPNQCLDQCWLIINGPLWHSSESDFTGNAQNICPWYKFGIYLLKITAAFSNEHIYYPFTECNLLWFEVISAK